MTTIPSGPPIRRLRSTERGTLLLQLFVAVPTSWAFGYLPHVHWALNILGGALIGVLAFIGITPLHDEEIEDDAS